MLHQISIFIENKPGTLHETLGIIKQENLQIVASSISDTAEYGIYRVICSEPSRAYQVLRDAGISVALSDVFAITLDNEPGRAADAVKVLHDAGISITYMYSFLLDGKGILVFRPDDAELTREAIILNGLSFVSEKELNG